MSTRAERQLIKIDSMELPSMKSSFMDFASVKNVWDCRSKPVFGTGHSLTWSGIFPRVSSFIYAMKYVVVGYVFKRGLDTNMLPTIRIQGNTSSVPSSRRIHYLTAISILGVILLSIAVKIAFWNLSSTVSTISPLSSSILPGRHLSNALASIVISLTAGILSELETGNSW